MKKILFVTLIVIAAFAVMRFFPKPSAGMSYPLDTVTSEVRAGAVALGGVLERQDMVSGRLRGVGRYGSAGTWFRDLTGLQDPADMNQLIIRNGPDEMIITSLSRSANVYELRIDPSPSTSKQSADLKIEILKRLPGLNFYP